MPKDTEPTELPDGGQRFKVRTPSPAFTGERAGVRIGAGVGYTDDQAAADACRGFGYAIEDRRPAQQPQEKQHADRRKRGAE